MEELQKSNGGQMLWLSGTQENRPHISYNHRFVFQFRYDGSNLSELFYFIDSYYERTRSKMTLCSRPHNFLYLTAHPRFVDWIIHNQDKITSLMTTDWEPLFKSNVLIKNGIHINDCMIDWQTGLNFMTCKFGHKHILPLFSMLNNEPFNWLNLADKTIYKTIDTYEVSSLKPTKCKCGRFSIGFQIVHRGLRYFPFRRDLAEFLLSHYVNLQFIRARDRLAIFYKTIGPMLQCDRDFLDYTFRDYTIEYVPDKLCLTGAKWPPFWDTSVSPVRVIDFVS
jgi:hypothetical protein